MTFSARILTVPEEMEEVPQHTDISGYASLCALTRGNFPKHCPPRKADTLPIGLCPQTLMITALTTIDPVCLGGLGGGAYGLQHTHGDSSGPYLRSGDGAYRSHSASADARTRDRIIEKSV